MTSHLQPRYPQAWVYPFRFADGGSVIVDWLTKASPETTVPSTGMAAPGGALHDSLVIEKAECSSDAHTAIGTRQTMFLRTVTSAADPETFSSCLSGMCKTEEEDHGPAVREVTHQKRNTDR